MMQIGKEPLIHFLFLGSLLYLYYNATLPKSQADANTITLSREEREEIKERYKRTYNQEIRKEQLALEVKKEIYKKVLLKEAYRLKLERSDEKIKERLLKQMEFIINNTQVFKEPKEEELRSYYLANIGEYSKIESFSFSYLRFRDASEKTLLETLELIKYLNVKNIEGEKHVFDATPQEIVALFGNYFLHKLKNLKTHSWSSPIPAKEGLILLYIEDKNVSEAYAFEDVEERVYEDYKQEHLQKLKREAYEALKKQYLVK